MTPRPGDLVVVSARWIQSIAGTPFPLLNSWTTVTGDSIPRKTGEIRAGEVAMVISVDENNTGNWFSGGGGGPVVYVLCRDGCGWATTHWLEKL